ncbi:MAG: hypothetical protein U9N39_04125 [Campylobacterota bacterium]|nr:hypothetical protein [Campylobacterota bacterium]
MSKLTITFIFTIFLTTQLFSDMPNPKPYAALGDVIYNNIDSIKKLKDIDSYQLSLSELEKYIADVEKAKDEGYTLENKSSSEAKKAYLKKLRELSKKNDYYLRDVKSKYKLSMKNDNFDVFTQIINSGTIDRVEHKKEIIDYYYLHSDDINSSGLIDEYLEEDAKLKALKDAQRARQKSKKMLQEEKIKRIRAMDLESQKRLEEKLQKDLMSQKLKIRETQKKELSH